MEMSDAANLLIPHAARRIAIIGNGGGGKSTLARRLSAARQLPWHEVDRAQFGPGWTSRPEPDVRETVQSWAAADEWIIDGFGPWDTIEARIARADVVVFVDHPLWVHNWLASRRQVDAEIGLGRLGGPPDCDLRDVHARMFETIDRVHREVRPRVVELLSRVPADRVVTIRGLEALTQVCDAESQVDDPPTFRVRPATMGDVSTLATLHRAFIADQASYLPVDRTNPDFDGADYFRRRLGDSDRATFVAAGDKGVIGFVDGRLLRSGTSRASGLKRALGRVVRSQPVVRPPVEAYLNNVYVDPPARRGRAAMALVEALSNWAVAKGAVALFTDVSDGNGAAVRMFEQSGFRRVRTGLRRELSD